MSNALTPHKLIAARNIVLAAAEWENNLSFQISMRIAEIMIKKGIKKIELATMMNIYPSLITRWLSGKHNFTIKTIAALEITLGEEIIRTAPHN